MIRLHNIKIPLTYTTKTLLHAAAQKLGVTQGQIARCDIAKKSVDARKKNDVCFVVSLDVSLKNASDEQRVAARLPPSAGAPAVPYAPAVPPRLSAVPAVRPVVVGFGPAGLFAALTLAQAGACPVVLERGQDVDTRTRDVAAYWERGEAAFSPASNVQFGEGGAGTFSDGKLNTPRIRAANTSCTHLCASARRRRSSLTPGRISAPTGSPVWSSPCANISCRSAAKCISARG